MWIDVNKRLPEDQDDVLVYMCKFGDIGNTGSQYLAYFDEVWQIYTENGIDNNANNNPDYWKVTHWQSLPTPPKQS